MRNTVAGFDTAGSEEQLIATVTIIIITTTTTKQQTTTTTTTHGWDKGGESLGAGARQCDERRHHRARLRFGAGQTAISIINIISLKYVL